jgi:hypothetical protein
MRNLLFVISLLSPFTLLSQTIDWKNFSEEKMNEVMFCEMNEYVKSLKRRDSVRINPENSESKYRAYDWHDYSKRDKQLMSEGAKWRTGDSLIHSMVIQNQIMPKNRNFIKKNSFRPLDALRLSHNKEWLMPDRGNDLHDTLRTKIIEENANPKLLKGLWIEECKIYGYLCYTEILVCSSFRYPEEGMTYQDIAVQFIDGWNTSPAHSAIMNANYRNKVICGVATYFDKESRVVYVSFVHVS